MILQVQSYGAGVQSVALLHMALSGEWCSPPDLVIFADTQAEPQHVYNVVERDAALCKAHSIEFVTVSLGDLSATDRWGGLFIPAFTLNERGDKGMLRRQCTQRFKVAPIRRELRRRGVKRCEMWLGISTDEARRARRSEVQWITHRWPLLEWGVSRDKCLAWLQKRDITAAKSACVFCPYHSDDEWLKIKGNPEDWQKAVSYDAKIRDKRPKGGEVFVHPQRVPLEHVSFENPDLQPGLWEQECGGGCGL